MKKILLLIIVGIIFTYIEPAYSQIIRKPVKIQKEGEQTFNVNVGVNFTTQYIWRGLNLANSPAFEPYGKFNFWDFEFDLIGVYGMNASVPNVVPVGSAVNFSKAELRLSYKIPTDIGNFALGFRDYIYPYSRLVSKNYLGNTVTKSFDWFAFLPNGEGAHTVEANVGYYGNKDYPIWLFFASNIYNDPNYSWYLEGGINFKISNENFSIFGGGTHGPSRWYEVKITASSNGYVGRSVWAPLNMGLGWEKVIPLSGSMSLPLSLKYIYNAYHDLYYVIVTVGFNVGG